MNNEILTKVDDIVEYIKTSDLYQKYLLLEQRMDNNDDINKLINKVKALQKKAVNQEYQGNLNEVKQLEQEINQKLEQLDTIPLYNEYINTKEELNNLFLNIKYTLEAYLNKKTN